MAHILNTSFQFRTKKVNMKTSKYNERFQPWGVWIFKPRFEKAKKLITKRNEREEKKFSMSDMINEAVELWIEREKNGN